MRILIVQFGRSWQATARQDAFFEVGDFFPTPEEAMRDAMQKLKIPKHALYLGDLLK